jgi:alpha-glucosidase
MEPRALEGPARWFEVDLLILEPVVHYRFLLEAEDGVWWYAGAGPVACDPLDATDFRIVAGIAPPAWVRGSVFYQIFPDRFANGDPSNDPRPEEYEYRGKRPRTFPWEESPGDHAFSVVFYGGYLAGITKRLEYLDPLGVTVLYLTPVFISPSNHRYDVADFEHIDPHLGGEAALAALRSHLSVRGMRYTLDIVPNHVGSSHAWFTAAQSDANAEKAAFFTFKQHPDQYHSWLSVQSLPKLNYQSEKLRRRMLTGPDVVLRRWLRPPFSADGWRVDVANLLGRQGPILLGGEIFRILREVVKDTLPDAYLLGENIFDPTAQSQGDQFDGMTNYASFTFPLGHWLCDFRQGVRGLKEPITGPPWTTEALEASWRLRLGHPLGPGAAPVQTCSTATMCRASAPSWAATRPCSGWRPSSSSPTRRRRASTTATRSAWRT